MDPRLLQLFGVFYQFAAVGPAVVTPKRDYCEKGPPKLLLELRQGG